MQQGSKKACLGVFSIAMITTGSVDSIRNLPAISLFGSSLIFYFLLGALLFLIPSALISAELASNSRKNNTIYYWVKEAFGANIGFLAIWFQWIENVIWYPTILSFLAGTVAYLLNPELANNKYFLITVIITTFWAVTFINLFGIKSSALLSSLCSIFGLLIPMALIMAMGCYWYFSGQPSLLSFSFTEIIPTSFKSNELVSLTGIILSFCGMEIATAHSRDVKNPQETYPKAMLLSVAIIIITLLISALSIATVVSKETISLVSGIMQAYNAFLASYNMGWLLPLLGIMLIIGGIGGVNNWVIAPTRGLNDALLDNGFSTETFKTNKHNSPQTLLIAQAVIASLVTFFFLFIPSINGAYWFLTVLASQFYMIMYVIMFLAAIKLRNIYPEADSKAFRIPGGMLGLKIVAYTGVIGSVLTLLVGFIPPEEIQAGSLLGYETKLIVTLMIFSSIPLALLLRKNQRVPSYGFVS